MKLNRKLIAIVGISTAIGGTVFIINIRQVQRLVNWVTAEHYFSWGVWKAEISWERNYALASAHYNRAIELNPNLTRAYYKRGQVLLDREKRNQDDACIEKEKGDQEIQNELTSYNTALKDINIALEKNPNLANAYVSRGFIYYQQGDYKSALEDFDQGIELDKNLEEAYLYRGRIYFKRGEQYYQEAIDNYNQALEINPKSVGAYFYRGEVYSKLGMKTEAIEEYQEGLRLDFFEVIGGNMPLHDDGLIYLVRGNIRKKDEGKGGLRIISSFEPSLLKIILQDYECALKFDPNLVEGYIELGDLYEIIADFSANQDEKKINYTKSLGSYNKALELLEKELYIYGIGITIQFDAETEAFTIINVLENSPAWNADIEVFDEILEVDGLPTDNLNIDDVINMIRGQAILLG